MHSVPMPGKRGANSWSQILEPLDQSKTRTPPDPSKAWTPLTPSQKLIHMGRFPQDGYFTSSFTVHYLREVYCSAVQ